MTEYIKDHLQQALNDSSNYLLYLQWNKNKNG
jgi:hypothetical protein